MKILLVIPTLKQGGAERVMSELANAFSYKGHEVHLCLLAEGEHFYELNSNIKVYNLGFINKGIFQKIIVEIKIFFRLRALMKSIKPKYILSFMTKYNILVIMASAFLNLKVFVSDRSNPKKKLPLLIKYLRKFTYKYATGIVAQTFLAKELLYKDTGNPNIRVIPNPLRKVQKYPNIERKNIILNIGRMVSEKGQEHLLKSFSKIKNTNWELVILGDGLLKNSLIIQAKKLGIEEKVHMIGTVKNVDEWLAKSSIFAFSSISEGFPNALVEAMAAGLPCVSFDCDAGPQDIIKNGINGYLVPVQDIKIFSDTLESLMENNKLRVSLGNEATNIQKLLDPAMIADKFLKFYEEEEI